jgi:ADP-ribose pyrophosphatase YjhB (NUDIX family)
MTQRAGDSETEMSPLRYPVPRVCAVIADQRGRILLCRYGCNSPWELPGSDIERDQGIEEALVQGISNETGLVVAMRYVVGVYHVPREKVVRGDAEARHELLLCIACRIVAGRLRPATEARELEFALAYPLASVPMRPLIRQCISDYRSHRLRAAVS